MASSCSSMAPATTTCRTSAGIVTGRGSAALSRATRPASATSAFVRELEEKGHWRFPRLLERVAPIRGAVRRDRAGWRWREVMRVSEAMGWEGQAQHEEGIDYGDVLLLTLCD